VKRTAFAATLSVLLGVFLNSAAEAAAIDLSLGPPAHASGIAQTPTESRVDPPGRPAMMSELAEPEVFAMMLVGLILIGYKVRRDSSEKFK
jgi:hypothetical protein